MRADRAIIVAILLLGGGIWTICAFSSGGTAALSLAFPISGTKLTVDLTTMGAPALIGVPLIIVGLAFAAIALIASIVAQFHSRSRDLETLHITDASPRMEVTPRYQEPFEG